MPELLLSGSLEDASSDHANLYQVSLDEAPPAPGELPGNSRVLHAHRRSSGATLPQLVALASERDLPLVVHPNRAPVERLIKDPETRSPLICLENFPWKRKKPLRTPLDILAFASSYGLSVCLDLAHFGEDERPAYYSVPFLRGYLPLVKVVHFSGQQHGLLSEAEWRVWRELCGTFPQLVCAVPFYVMEHRLYSDKLRDRDRLQQLLARAANRYR